MTNAEARFNKSHIRKVYACLAVTCHLRFWRNDRVFYVLLREHGGGTDTEIRVSTESRPWRRKFSRRSIRDSNPRPFDHESGSLTTELSPLPVHCSLSYVRHACLAQVLLSRCSWHRRQHHGNTVRKKLKLKSDYKQFFTLILEAGKRKEKKVPHQQCSFPRSFSQSERFS